MCDMWGPLGLAHPLVPLGRLGPWLPHSSLPCPTTFWRRPREGPPGLEPTGRAVRVSEASAVQTELAVSGWKGGAPNQGLEVIAPQGTCCSGGGQEGAPS